jgi:hypothetical protein
MARTGAVRGSVPSRARSRCAERWARSALPRPRPPGCALDDGPAGEALGGGHAQQAPAPAATGAAARSGRRPRRPVPVPGGYRARRGEPLALRVAHPPEDGHAVLDPAAQRGAAAGRAGRQVAVWGACLPLARTDGQDARSPGRQQPSGSAGLDDAALVRTSYATVVEEGDVVPVAFSRESLRSLTGRTPGQVRVRLPARSR